MLPIQPKYDTASYEDLRRLYESTGFKEIIQRHCSYLRECPYGIVPSRILPASLIIAGGIVGFTTASKISEDFQLGTNKKIAVLGGGIIIGGLSGAYVYITITENSIFFKTWKCLKLTPAAEDLLSKRYGHDEFLNQFLDCIHYTPLIVPVRLKTGYLVDLTTLKTIRKDGNGEVLCPHTKEKLDLNNPNVDLELYILIKKRYQSLIKEELLHLDENSPEYQELSSQLEVIENLLTSSYQNHLKGLDSLHAAGKLTYIELNRLRAQFYENFGVDPIGNADEENEIRAHIMDFTKNWKKIISAHSKLLFKGTPETQFIENA